MARPWPTRLAFRSSDRALHATFDDGVTVRVPYELLRVESPSAEVQGHAPDQKKLVTGKEQVEVTQAEPVGRYAVRLTFSDGHNSGIFSFDLIRELGENAGELMAEYRAKVAQAKMGRG
ncbi:DUF971 domain-containing protein [Marinicauda algicola]|uniref:DUF971 domain-containing protein n=1 Tax=Marinicauda algicola TaxID=2029849 RepID=A0A4S2H151_9PROT|nr:gamma-butyrobetaine hydroxylase-like domain-containing protein [Marinicauda algicola]TGY89206.1 DUF971 domain-containing protein [Marinicauda algicola]